LGTDDKVSDVDMDNYIKDCIENFVRGVFGFSRIDEEKVIMDIMDVKSIIPKANVDNKFIYANSNVFKENIVPTSIHTCLFRTSIEMNSPIELVLFSVFASRDFKTTEKYSVLKKFSAEGVYKIVFPVSPNETINIRFDRDMDVRKISVEELYVTHGV
jgi:hypothetical protein